MEVLDAELEQIQNRFTLDNLNMVIVMDGVPIRGPMETSMLEGEKVTDVMVGAPRSTPTEQFNSSLLGLPWLWHLSSVDGGECVGEWQDGQNAQTEHREARRPRRVEQSWIRFVLGQTFSFIHEGFRGTQLRIADRFRWISKANPTYIILH